ncbi:LysM peptidoglycan-binding domain-containing protein [Kribbella sp. NBC_00709]|nr:LysM peptidoglycan-binding domain-containing protein [Kribbella sp. NBC_00709]
MIRALKGTLAVLALVALGLLLRWMTAGSISGLRTYDLDSLTVLAVGTVAWIAYVWLALAVVTTVLEQIPGVVGELAGAVAGRITTKTARALLRSGLGVAAVTPLTVGIANAAPGDSAHVLQWDQTEPASTIHLTDSDWRSTEPASTLEIGGAGIEPQHGAEASSGWRASEPPSTIRMGDATPTTSGRPPVSERMRVGVPDRPTAGAPTRYTDVRAGGSVRVVVRAGDSLWAIAARELGPGATVETIAARWPDWYAANRHVIGDDPDLILPGQVLRVPPASTGHLPPTHQEP